MHGILVQLPLPKHINEKRVLDAISIEKDVDGEVANDRVLGTGNNGDDGQQVASEVLRYPLESIISPSVHQGSTPITLGSWP